MKQQHLTRAAQVASHCFEGWQIPHPSRMGSILAEIRVSQGNSERANRQKKRREPHHVSMSRDEGDGTSACDQRCLNLAKKGTSKHIITREMHNHVNVKSYFSLFPQQRVHELILFRSWHHCIGDCITEHLPERQRRQPAWTC